MDKLRFMDGTTIEIEDGATNPTAIGPSQVIFGTITYITNDWA